MNLMLPIHDDVIKWKHIPRYWPFVRRIHRSPVNSPHKGQWRLALMFPLICVWINDWVNNGEAGDLRRYRIHYDVTVMCDNCIDKQKLILLAKSKMKWFYSHFIDSYFPFDIIISQTKNLKQKQIPLKRLAESVWWYRPESGIYV